MKKGIQMYAIRDLCGEDLEAGLRAAAEIGYEGVEFAGFFGHTAGQVAGWLTQYGLTPLGAHIPPDEIFGHTDETIAFHQAIGNRRIICPWYDLKSTADVNALAEKMLAAAPKLKAAGMKLFYHNHAHEFVKDNGKCLLDLLAEQVGGDILSLEFDVYWIYRGGEDPLEYLKKYAGRVEIFHAKDGTAEGGTIAGTGNVPLPAVIEYAKTIGMEWAVVESEASDERYAQIIAATKDYDYISALL